MQMVRFTTLLYHINEHGVEKSGEVRRLSFLITLEMI
jgi:hypothetical protein